MSLESWLAKKNENIRSVRTELILEAGGYNTKLGITWWQRNHLTIILWTFLTISCLTCYLLGFQWVAWIIGFAIILKGSFTLWELIKKGWTLLKTFYQMRKLLKQMSALKKE